MQVKATAAFSDSSVTLSNDVAAIVPEEPASMLFTGIFNRQFPKKGERYTPADAAPLYPDPRRYYTPLPDLLRAHQPEGRVRRYPNCVVQILVARQSAVDRLSQQVGQRKLPVASRAWIHQILPDQLAQTEPFVQLPHPDF